MSSQNITIAPAQPSDFLALSRLEIKVFHDEDFSAVAFGSLRGSEDAIRRRARNFEEAFMRREEGQKWRYVKAVDEDGRFVGLAGWSFNKAEEKTAQSGKEEGEAENRWGPSANVRFCREVFGAADEVMSRSCEGRDYAKLGTLVVSPDCQRQGIGTLLLEEGLKEVDERGLQCVLGASPQGEELYKRVGFREVSVNNIKMWEYGGEGMGIVRHVVMHRPAKKSS